MCISAVNLVIVATTGKLIVTVTTLQSCKCVLASSAFKVMLDLIHLIVLDHIWSHWYLKTTCPPTQYFEFFLTHGYFWSERPDSHSLRQAFPGGLRDLTRS